MVRRSTKTAAVCPETKGPRSRRLTKKEREECPQARLEEVTKEIEGEEIKKWRSIVVRAYKMVNNVGFRVREPRDPADRKAVGLGTEPFTDAQLETIRKNGVQNLPSGVATTLKQLHFLIQENHIPSLQTFLRLCNKGELRRLVGFHAEPFTNANQVGDFLSAKIDKYIRRNKSAQNKPTETETKKKASSGSKKKSSDPTKKKTKTSGSAKASKSTKSKDSRV